MAKAKATTTKTPSAKTTVKTTKTVTPKATAPKATKATAPVKKSNVLFVTTEAAPFAATGGMGEVCTALPRALNKSGKAEARVMLPLYEEIAYRFKEKMTFVCNITVALAWRNQYCGLFRMEHNGVVFYFVDNEYYFKRSDIYGYYDDAERFAFFSRAALELIPYLDFKPDVLQSNDHLTALVPIYYSIEYKHRAGYGNIKNVFTIHNISYQGVYPMIIAGDVFGLSEENLGLVECNGQLNLVKGAICAADKITVMSPQYAREIRLPEFSGGLDGVLINHRDKIEGILNGIDAEEFDPEISPSLFKNYTADTIENKAKNKLELQRMLSLPEDANIPMLCMIAHMVPHKGFDLLRKSINKVAPEANILDANIQLIIIGQGDHDVEGYFTHTQTLYDRKVRALITYNRDLAQKVLAGADMCLIPSRTEPCGLTQMQACRFGAVPIARATGGLIDSIKDCANGDGNGFVFEEYDSDVMDKTITRAVNMYCNHKDEWLALAKRAMACDFSWNKSARKYSELYKSLIG